MSFKFEKLISENREVKDLMYSLSTFLGWLRGIVGTGVGINPLDLKLLRAFKSFGGINTAFQPRIELQDPLKVAHSLAFSSKANFETYEIKPKIEFFATPDKGTGIFLAGNFSYFLSEFLTLKFLSTNF